MTANFSSFIIVFGIEDYLSLDQVRNNYYSSYYYIRSNFRILVYINLDSNLCLLNTYFHCFLYNIIINFIFFEIEIVMIFTTNYHHLFLLLQLFLPFCIFFFYFQANFFISILLFLAILKILMINVLQISVALLVLKECSSDNNLVNFPCLKGNVKILIHFSYRLHLQQLQLSYIYLIAIFTRFESFYYKIVP